MGLDKHEIFRNFSKISQAGNPIIIAVSGGSDSLALMYLYAAYAAGNECAAKPHIVTIDHGLRPEARDEALFVASISASLGFPHKTILWGGDKPQSSLQEKARGARHRLLRDYARGINASIILLGHTLDDQSETYAMRKERSDAVRGLAAMAPATLFHSDVWLTRPLLMSKRQDLRDYLSEQNQIWIDDPSNHDARYERVRIRSQLLMDHEAARLDAEKARRKENEATTHFVKQYFSRPSATIAAVKALPNDLLATNAALLAFRFALALMGGRSYLPSENASKDALQRLANGAVTLSGCVIHLKNDVIEFQRECRGGDRILNAEETYQARLDIFDAYLPSFDLPLANAFAPFFGRNRFPASPLG